MIVWAADGQQKTIKSLGTQFCHGVVFQLKCPSRNSESPNSVDKWNAPLTPCLAPCSHSSAAACPWASDVPLPAMLQVRSEKRQHTHSKDAETFFTRKTPQNVFNALIFLIGWNITQCGCTFLLWQFINDFDSWPLILYVGSAGQLVCTCALASAN